MKLLSILLNTLLVVVALCTVSCAGSDDDAKNQAKQYYAEVTIQIQTNVYVGEREYSIGEYDSRSYSEYRWEDSVVVSYELYLDESDSAEVEFPGTVTIDKLEDGDFKLVFGSNSNDNICGMKNMPLTISLDARMRWTGYTANDCGRTRFGATIELNE